MRKNAHESSAGVAPEESRRDSQPIGYWSKDVLVRVYKQPRRSRLKLFTIIGAVLISALTLLYAGLSDYGRGKAYAPNEFVTTWKTDNPGASANNQITIPTYPGESYNYTVNWGDGNTTTGHTGGTTHTYVSPGTYTVSITGVFPRIYFDNSGDKQKILTIEQWSTNAWTSMGGAFYGASNLTLSALDTPNLSGVTDMSRMFQGASSFNSNINGWDVSNVNDMRSMFSGATAFNQPLNSWNVGSVTNMSGMFLGATSFNQSLNNWNVSNVTDMEAMFRGAHTFNGNISAWDVGSLTTMRFMFADAWAFNQPLGSWDVSSVTIMETTFANAISFNQPIGNWQTAGVTDMSWMFASTNSFNQDISGWNLSSVTDINNMFGSTFGGNFSELADYSTAFNQSLNSWDVSSVTDMRAVFNGAKSFNQPLNNWNTGNVVYMGGMFGQATSFNQPLNNWNTGNVVDMSGMFASANSFNQPLNNWDVSSVSKMVGMFTSNTAFDQSLADWDVSNVTDMMFMFGNYDAYVEAIMDMTNLPFEDLPSYFQDMYGLPASGLSTSNYDATLISWASRSLQENVPFDAGTSVYCNSEAQRQSIIDTKYWVITDAGKCPTAPPSVTTLPATNIAATTTTLNGQTSPAGVTERGFEYGTTTGYGQSVQDGSMLTLTYESQFGSEGSAAGQFNDPRGMAVDQQGNIYIADNTNDRVQKFSSDGNFIAQIGGPGSGNGQFDGPNDIVFTADGSFYVTDGENHRVQKFDANGNFLNKWGQNGSAPGEFGRPRGIDIDAAGNIYVADNLNSRVQKFDQNFTYLSSSPNYIITGGPSAVAVDADNNIYVTVRSGPYSNSANWVMKFDASWNLITQWGGVNVSTSNGKFNAPEDISLDQQGNVYVADSGNHRVQIFDSDGNFITKIGYGSAASGSGDGQFTWLKGLTLTTQDKLLVADSGNDRVQQFTGLITASALSGLTCNTTYHYRAYATNSGGTSYGADETFTTAACTGGPTEQDPFIMRVKTDNGGPGPDSDTRFWIETGSYTYDYDVDCNNDGIVEHTNQSGDVTCIYGSPGEYDVAISGTFPHYNGCYGVDQLKIIDVVQWGDIEWLDMSCMFWGAHNLQSFSAVDSPNLANVTSMRYMFNYADIFNDDISAWDVSNVTDMAFIFAYAESFNQPLNNWDVSNVTDMSQAFNVAYAFNQPLDNWNVSSVTDMTAMFFDASNFNQNINSWDVSNVTDMEAIFNAAADFNQPLNNWNVSNVTSFESAFAYAQSFNQALNSWNVSSATELTYMFSGATLFNQNINSWDVSNVVNFGGMFRNAFAFNQPLNNWDVSSGQQFGYMFFLADSFNQSLNNWDVSSATDTQVMFAGAATFNQNISSWDVSNVVNMMGMFTAAQDFDQSLADWDVSNVTDMMFMFGDADGYFPVTSGLSTSNYDATLISWSLQNLQPSVTFDAGPSAYCNSEAQRQSIIDTKTWTINDGGKDCSALPPSVTTLPATDITATTATLNGQTSPAGVTERGFEYGTTTGYGQTFEDNSDINPRFTKKWGVQGSGIGEFDNPSDIAVGPSGNVYVADRSNSRVQKFDADGNYLTQWGGFGYGDGQFWTSGPVGIAVDASENVYVGDYYLNRVQKFDASGNYVTEWPTSGNTLYGVSVGKDGYVYVSTLDRVAQYTQGGVFIRDFGPAGVWGPVGIPSDAIADEDGNVYVSDLSNDRIHKYDSAANYLGAWGDSNVSWQGSSDGKLQGPRAIDLDASGNVIVADTGNSRIQLFSATDGSYLDQWGSAGTGDGEFVGVTSVAVGSNYKYYTADYGGHHIQLFEAGLIEYALSGLTCNTTYHYRAYATNSGGTSYGADETFTTAACSGGPTGQDPFIMRVKTDNNGSTANNEFLIPTNSTIYSYNYAVDCNNDGTPEYTAQTGDVTCSYGSPGEYDIAISGEFPHFDGGTTEYYDRQKITQVKQWGDIEWLDMSGMFFGASNMQMTAVDTPDLSNVVFMGFMFEGATSFNTNINNWDVSNVTDMRNVFAHATAFNQPLNNWDVSNVTYMSGAFWDASSFNQPLNNWDVSSVVYMTGLFYATPFNQPLNNWDVSNVAEIGGIFWAASSFNQPLNNWDVSNVTAMPLIFTGATAFNQPLNNWDVSNVMSMEGMFAGASSFNQSLADWDISNVTDMVYMFGDGDGYFPGTSGLSTSNYDATLISWSQQNLQPSVTFDAGTSTYCNAEAQRQSIIDTKTWTINDSGKDCSALPPSVTTLSATDITATTATLNGQTSPAGVTERGFEFGTTTGYGQTFEDSSPSNYSYVRNWGSQGGADGDFYYPTGVAISQNGDVYVADNYNHRIQKFDSDGNFITKWGGNGSGNGEFNIPVAVAIDGSGNIYVTDHDNDRIQKFDSDGNFITKWGGNGSGNGELNFPQGIAVDGNGDVIVVDSGNYRIQKFDSDGNFITKWGISGSGDGEFNSSPSGVAIGLNNEVYVSEGGLDRIQKFDTNGNYIDKWGSEGAADGQFDNPEGLAVDAEGNVYVAESGNDRIQKFDSDGNFITKWGENGSGDGELDYPTGIAVGARGVIYVADTFNQRIQSYSTSILNSILGLACGTTYHYRAYATNSNGMSYGDDEIFQTSACPPGQTPSPSPSPTTLPSSPPGAPTTSPTVGSNPAPSTQPSTTITPQSPAPSTGDSPSDSSAPRTTSRVNPDAQSPDQATGRSSASLLFGLVPEGALDGIRLIPQPVARTLPFMLILILVALAGLYARQAWVEYRTLIDLKHTLTRYRGTQEATKNFVALTSHYLNTPVNILQASTELIASSKLLDAESISKLSLSIENLAHDVKSLVTGSQVVTAHVSESEDALKKLKIGNPFMSLFVIIPIVIVALASVILNLLFTAAERYRLDTVMLVGQVIAFILAAGLIALAWRSYKRHQAGREIYKQQATLEYDLLNRRVEFIRKSYTELNADVGYVEQFASAIPSGAAAAKPFFNAITMFHDVLAKFGSMIEYSKPVEKMPPAITVAPVVQATLDARSDAIKAKQLRVTHNIPVNIVAQIDRQALNQLISSLIDNAIKFSKDGGEISINARVVKNAIELLIQDNGIGIEPSKLSQLMTPFSRATDVMQFDYEGIGMSLYLNKVLLEQIGGTIKLDSTLNKGTLVTVQLPSGV